MEDWREKNLLIIAELIKQPEPRIEVPRRRRAGVRRWGKLGEVFSAGLNEAAT